MDLKYFTLKEFDSPDLPGSGDQMNYKFLQKLDDARVFAGVPFKINSGFRTKKYNEDLIRRKYKASRTSSHLKGLAADIHCTDSDKRWKIINGLLRAGFRRLGIADTFIHVDLDTEKSQNVIWKY